jgi:hypothetical protein
MRQSYKKPRKLNFVSVLVILILLSLFYVLIQFGPPYWRKWKAKEALSESASKVYGKRYVSDEAAAPFLEQVQQQTMAKLRDFGIEDPDLKVNVIKDSEEITVEAEYMERIKHPLIGKYTNLRFRPFHTLEVDR